MEYMYEVHYRRSLRMRHSAEMLQEEEDPMLFSSRQKSDMLPLSKTSLLEKTSVFTATEFLSEHKKSLTMAGQSEVITTFTSPKVCYLW